MKQEIMDYWDSIKEYEIDDSWQRNLSEEYKEYRRQFDLAKKKKYEGKFPLSIEIEASYYCNLKCPKCPRSFLERKEGLGHMNMNLWERIFHEAKPRGLKAILMDHEAESLMNPHFLEMLKIAKSIGIIDIWLHTNANLLTEKVSEKLIDYGLTKINFSIDAASPSTYNIVRKGGNFKRVIKNIEDFLKLKIEKKADYLRTRVSYVVMEENIREKEGFFKFWKNKPGLNIIAFQRCIDYSLFMEVDEESKLSEKELEQKYKDVLPFTSTLPWEMLIIDISGNIVPCGSPVREHNGSFILGNIGKGETIESCWNGEKMKRLRDVHENGEWYKIPMCRVCAKATRGF